MFKNVLITGGAGFVGSNLAFKFAHRHKNSKVKVLDNLKRRGSELNLNRFKQKGIEFIHGDIRNVEDYPSEKFDLVIDCSAEPSVLSGLNGSPQYTINTNLIGTLNCLEFARCSKAAFAFISTSRVYPYDLLNNSNIVESETRFEYSDGSSVNGLSKYGVSEDFSVIGPKSIYGATKLAAELFVTEYIRTYKMDAIIDRLGCIAGPWQMGKVDQGVMALWISRHLFNKELKYIGFGGKGKQVRDFIHIDDVFEILDIQLLNIKQCNNEIFNVGGGCNNSVSLLELTQLCKEVTGNEIQISSDMDDRPADLKIYISDNNKVSETFDWFPKKSVKDIVKDTSSWILDNRDILENILLTL